MLDVLIEGAEVADGGGGPTKLMPVGIVDGRLRLGDDVAGASAKRRIDASGLVLSPGFIDVHTHFDAQVFWDPYLTPSSLHGVTTVVAGNCGFSIAPLTSEGADYMLRLLARVEGIPQPALERGVPWDWTSFGEYLQAVDRSRPALNFGAMVGHSALRRRAMGDDCHAPDPGPEALGDMREQLRQGLSAGAIGFSSSWGDAHFDGDGNPVPSRAARPEELVALCQELAAFPGTQVEFIPTLGQFGDVHVELMTAMSLAARSPLNWNILMTTDPETCRTKLAASDYAASRGGRVVALSYPGPLQARVSFMSSIFDAIPGWSETLALDPAELAARLADPGERRRLRELAEAHGRTVPGGLTSFDELRVLDTYTDDAKPLEGRSLGELAKERGEEAFDILCDLAVADLRTGFGREPIGNDATAWQLRLESWRDERVVLGASDAGAHVDILSTFDYPVALLAMARQREAMELGDAVRALTDVPASLYGFTGMGRIEDGYRADLVLFDPQRVGPGQVTWRDDLPGGAGRLYGEPLGIERVLVNGVETVAEGRLTGERPGRMLRAGEDTGPNF